jgi:hypothetical protein
VSLAGRLVVPVVVAGISLAALLALPPLSTARALAIWVVIVAALSLIVLIRHPGWGSGSPRARRFEAAVRGRAPAASQPVEFLRMERELELGIAGAAHAHHRLLPLLRAAAEARLSSRHRIELDRRADAARALLGEEAWELLRPDRPEPADRFAPGVPRSRVAAVIDRVESL